jgi:GLPGLI family protein
MILRKIVITILVTTKLTACLSQAFTGEVIYRHTFDPLFAYRALPFFEGSALETRSALRRPQKEIYYRQLYADSTGSLYQNYNAEGKTTGQAQQSFYLYHAPDSLTTHRGMMYGKPFEVQGHMSEFKWKILDSIKEIAGYMCLKAQAYEGAKGQLIVAWFTMDLPGNEGPEFYRGLPGLILEVDINNGAKVIEAISVRKGKIVMPKIADKKPRRVFSAADYQKHVAEMVRLSVARREYPFVDLSY